MPKRGINIYERRKHWLSKYKLAKGCGSCGYAESPRALCFDHLVPGSKHSMIKTAQRNTSYGGGMANLYRAKYPVEVLMAEVRKCQVLCLNCHAEKTEAEQAKGKKG